MSHLIKFYRLQERKILAGHAYAADRGFDFESRAAALDELDRIVHTYPTFYGPQATHKLVVLEVQP